MLMRAQLPSSPGRRSGRAEREVVTSNTTAGYPSGSERDVARIRDAGADCPVGYGRRVVNCRVLFILLLFCSLATTTMPANQQYTYDFDGVSEILDHILTEP
jgi:hypothetical protein